MKKKRRARRAAKPPLPSGGQTVYTDEIAERILAELAAGKSLVKVCEARGMPSRRTVMRWLNNDEKFRALYVLAKEECADLLAEAIVEIADNGGKTGTKEKVNRDRLRVDSRKWVAAKLKPQKYGDKFSAELTGKDGAPLVTPVINVSIGGDQSQPTPGAGKGVPQ